MDNAGGWIVALIILIFVIIVLSRSVRIVPQARAGVVERLGRYQKTLNPGLALLIPFVDRIRPLIDLREQVVSFPPQPVITEDNLVVSIDTVVYFQVTDARAATYEIANYIQAVEQLTTTTLRNVVGGLNLEQALTSRDQINGQLRGVLDEATGKWGIRVSRVELKAIDPPLSIQDSMEKQMRAERDRRAVILTAEGTKQSQILTAEGERQSSILQAEGAAKSAVLEAEGAAKASVLRADGESAAIMKVFNAIHEGKPDQKLLAYQYLQTLPKIAEGTSNKLWVIPSEVGEALKGIGGALGNTTPDDGGSAGLMPPATRDDDSAGSQDSGPVGAPDTKSTLEALNQDAANAFGDVSTAEKEQGRAGTKLEDILNVPIDKIVEEAESEATAAGQVAGDEAAGEQAAEPVIDDAPEPPADPPAPKQPPQGD
ncbi:SPFH domain-containing protein [Spelaeicoccus albus]|uniref:Regulator of protease activity HflC (Stomatin/prohibitin superfamily) n=1 Tax=Spelaeicoccus albus TaxID=1280376 RepID=A0A7Z0A8Y4_9MICO|nr:SPFH domain-containing protein [Spelaeicoccus albus]NYI66569.1 regulator of protease activity HflC (stomatin/prohibitin superfamily) [Spelaeicoccus albus]